MTPSKRLAINTLAQYVRTVANVLLVLVATRLIFRALGSNDYGIYSLVAGVVSMLTFFTNALTTTTQRFLSYNYGKGNIRLLAEYFTNSVIIHIGLGCILALIMLGALPLLFNGFLNIPAGSLSVAKDVYMLLIAMLFISLIASPLRAVLLAHENIVYISVVDIMDGVLKLLIGVVLTFFMADRLIWYAVLMCCVTSANLIAFSAFCFIKYRECREMRLSYLDKTKVKELTAFAGWTIYGTLCLFGRVQGVAIVLNKFFGTVINAAYGIALQVNAALGAVSGALQTALAPQLIKAEGENNRVKMLMLSEFGCKMSFILLSYVAFPLLFEMNGILKLWLGNPPANASFLCSLLIVANMADQLTVGFNTTMNAVGKIRNFLLTVNTLKFMTVFILAGLLWLKMNLYWALSFYLWIEIIGCVLRVMFCKKYVGLNVAGYVERVLLRLLIPVGVISAAYWMMSAWSFSILSFIIKFIVGSLVYTAALYFFGLDADEKSRIKTLFQKFRPARART